MGKFGELWRGRVGLARSLGAEGAAQFAEARSLYGIRSLQNAGLSLSEEIEQESGRAPLR